MTSRRERSRGPRIVPVPLMVVSVRALGCMTVVVVVGWELLLPPWLLLLL